MENTYAPLVDSVKALVIDTVIVVAAMYATSEIFDFFDAVPNYARIGAAVVILLLYDPFFTSQFGGTIGHFYSNIEVRQDVEQSRKIPFYRAFIRFIIKSTLGWLSLLTVTSNDQKQAIHDFAAKSVVLKRTK